MHGLRLKLRALLELDDIFGAITFRLTSLSAQITEARAQLDELAVQVRELGVADTKSRHPSNRTSGDGKAGQR